jgi:hypothetical protein
MTVILVVWDMNTTLQTNLLFYGYGVYTLTDDFTYGDVHRRTIFIQLTIASFTEEALNSSFNDQTY